MLTLLICAAIFLRWPILQRFLGTIRMFLFDAILFTVIAALNCANPGNGGWAVFSYIIGGFCVLLAIQSGRKYLKYSEIQRIENGKGKSDSGTAAGS